MLDPLTSVLLTVLVVVVAVNAINFVDGLDGLAAGIVGIGALAFFAYSYLLSFEYGFTRATLAALVSAILAGMCAGFLPHNLNPARIFMGDTGSMLIGLLLASSVITLVGQLDPNVVPGPTFVPALLPILLPRGGHGRAAARHAAGRRTPHPRRAQPVLARTSSTCTTACSSSATASAARCCSCTAGPGCWPSRRSGWPSSRSGVAAVWFVCGVAGAGRRRPLAALRAARRTRTLGRETDLAPALVWAANRWPPRLRRARRLRRTDLLRPDPRRRSDPAALRASVILTAVVGVARRRARPARSSGANGALGAALGAIIVVLLLRRRPVRPRPDPRRQPRRSRSRRGLLLYLTQIARPVRPHRAAQGRDLARPEGLRHHGRALHVRLDRRSQCWPSTAHQGALRRARRAPPSRPAPEADQ